jgi:hypothetical protein
MDENRVFLLKNPGLASGIQYPAAGFKHHVHRDSIHAGMIGGALIL